MTTVQGKTWLAAYLPIARKPIGLKDRKKNGNTHGRRCGVLLLRGQRAPHTRP